jgi:Lipase (class 3)
MTISVELSYAILALDSYNRGYNFGVPGLGGIGSQVGNYTLVMQSETLSTSPEVAASFYAAAYLNGGNIVISYRGTDNINPFGPDVTAWTGGLGFQTEQAELAAQFYYQVKQEYPGANIVLTGHSLGGGLAGLVARVTGSAAYIYDNMPFELSAENAYDTEGLARACFAHHAS